MRLVFAASLILFPLACSAEDRDLASLHQFNGTVQWMGVYCVSNGARIPSAAV